MNLNLDHEFVIRLTEEKSEKPDWVAFQECVQTDHMIQMRYETGKGWQTPEICPRKPIIIEPGSEVFWRSRFCTADVIAGCDRDGVIQIFRARETVQAMQMNCRKKGLPVPEADLLTDGIRALAEVEKDWIPTIEGAFLRIRILNIPEAAEAAETGKTSQHSHCSRLILSAEVCPSPRKYVRLSSGRELSANHFLPAEGGEDTCVALIGADDGILGGAGVNLFFRAGNTIITPPAPLGGPVYSDVMRDTAICILEESGMTVVEDVPKLTAESFGVEGETAAEIGIKEIGSIDEIFITGLTRGVGSVLEWSHFGKTIWTADEKKDEAAALLRRSRNGLLNGSREDRFRWILYANKHHG